MYKEILAISIVIVLFVAAIVGYGLNIYKLTQCDFETPYKCEVLHSVGLIPIAGIFVGWMEFGK